MSWQAFKVSVAEAQKLAQPDDFDFLPRVGDSYATLRASVSVGPAATSSACRTRRAGRYQHVAAMQRPEPARCGGDAPVGFVKKRWAKLVLTSAGIDRRYYELCVMRSSRTHCDPATSGLRGPT
jgi:hypothetical protein